MFSFFCLLLRGERVGTAADHSVQFSTDVLLWSSIRRTFHRHLVDIRKSALRRIPGCSLYRLVEEDPSPSPRSLLAQTSPHSKPPGMTSCYPARPSRRALHHPEMSTQPVGTFRSSRRPSFPRLESGMVARMGPWSPAPIFSGETQSLDGGVPSARGCSSCGKPPAPLPVGSSCCFGRSGPCYKYLGEGRRAEISADPANPGGFCPGRLFWAIAAPAEVWIARSACCRTRVCGELSARTGVGRFGEASPDSEPCSIFYSEPGKARKDWRVLPPPKFRYRGRTESSAKCHSTRVMSQSKLRCRRPIPSVISLVGYGFLPSSGRSLHGFVPRHLHNVSS